MSYEDEIDNSDQLVIDISNGSGLARQDEVLPEKLYIIPITSRPFFPAQIQPVIVSKKRWAETLRRVAKSPHMALGLIYVGDQDPDQVLASDLPLIGCVVRVHNATADDNNLQFVAQGIKRFRIEQWFKDKPPMLAQVSYPEARIGNSDSIKAYAMAVVKAIKDLLPLNPLYTEELKNYLSRFSPNDPSPLTDFAAAITSAKGSELQAILETLPIRARMEKVLVLLRKEMDVAELQSSITARINEQVSDNQREFFLREQLKIIQKELGLSKDDKTSDVDQFRERLTELKPPAYAQEKIEEELNKLSVLDSGSPEYGVTRNYLDWATSVPWGVYSDDKLDLDNAQKVLDAHHDGLDDVKERIKEFLAVGVFKGEIAGSILLLVGPPGVGKTSIGRSIADALGREFYRFSLGGMRDEAEIKGHRRTYIGAMPGKFIQALKQVKVSNPVIMLDEIDKVGASYHGDPASALLEVLDPEQNSEFRDHYIDMPVDLSKVLFVCTANQLDTIPGPLLDRMETIRLAGYITEEKLSIAKRHLWPRALKQAGVNSRQLRINQGALKVLIEGYAREAGVRNLEKQLKRIIRKAVVKLLDDPKQSIRVGKDEVAEYLGPPMFRQERVLSGIGVVTGLAWTSMGGVTLPIEATRVHTNNPGFKLTGKLGDVMRESAEIAHSYVISNLEHYDCDQEFFDKSYIHVHVPEGATPKDGPSAGVTMTTALISLARKQAIPRPLAMTGEITLTGQVLAVGGIREKVIAARRSKIKELLLPEACRRDFEELPDYLQKGLTVHFADHYDQVFDLVFGK
ncbi:MAG: endopeptidase La [Pseudomonadales bacterium]